jgi:hypothetical protein
VNKNMLAVCGLVLALVLSNALLLKQTVLADDKTVTGSVTCEKDGDGNVTNVSLKTDDGTKYTVTTDDNGKKLAKELDGKKATVTGDVTEKDETKWLKVSSYKAAE